ncbi:MAG: DUF6544 family protein [Flavobacteriales bacterium]
MTLRILLSLLLVLHGAIHLLGFVKAYGLANVPALTLPISKPIGALWAMTAALFVIAFLLLLLANGQWWVPAGIAVALSQVLIVLHWHDARFGTIANTLLLVAVIAGASVWNFRARYTAAVDRTMELARAVKDHRITEVDLAPLPEPVQRFLRRTGVVGTLRPRTMRITFQGSIRGFNGPWMPFTTVQVNAFNEPARFFWLDATMKGIPTKGLHGYANGKATMLIKVLGMIPVMEAHGPEMDQAETVTWFNDHCLFAPGALLDPRITWTPVDDRSAKATFSHLGISISAMLVFDASDRLVDFISEDRYALQGDAAVRMGFSTPARDHRPINGLLLPGYGEAVWLRPDGPFPYGRFTVLSVTYDQ